MKEMSASLQLFVRLARVNAIMARRFDGRLGHGLGFNDFVILLALSQSANGRMRRIDLAECLGITASGVTRMLAPMEKIGLVKREANVHDARVSYVALAAGGKRLLAESLESAEVLSEEVVAPGKAQKLNELLAGSLNGFPAFGALV
ncbi:MarR family winged helix-turn-helix transcriptional regulator [Pedosphaera parvula]|nr:MarR family winged helix-turn-helix transcriptional regulator [Pedosphaera parvula]